MRSAPSSCGDAVGSISAIAGSAPAPSIPQASSATDSPGAAGGATTLLSPDYTVRDHEVVDYEFYELPEIPAIRFRGPRLNPPAAGDFFTCIGAAQTLGVYVKHPFPQIVARECGLPAWNVGIGGASPSFFATQDHIIQYANRSRFVILQILAARAESNSRFRATAATEMVHDLRRGDVVRTPIVWDRIIQEEPEKLTPYIAESRATWANGCRLLLSRIKVPTILFWFSPKPLHASIDLMASSGAGLMDRYPHFVDGCDVEALMPMSAGFAACLSSRNTGHPLISRFTGRPVEVDYATLGDRAAPIKESHNVYYPSPEMHEDAAAVLVEALAQLGLVERR